MYNEIQQSSNGDKHHMTGIPTYATVSIDGNKHNQGMLTHACMTHSL